MKVYVESILPCDPDQAWAEVLKSSLLRHVAWPLITFCPVGGDELPARWKEGASVQCKSYLFGILPLGTRSLFFESIDPYLHVIDTRESDPLVSRWDHRIQVQATKAGDTRYSDGIEIHAGWFTFFVWLFAQCFYRHRQRRWKAVARRLAACSIYYESRQAFR